MGFLFDASFDKVVLIHKKRPEWQKDKYNGVGGHVEQNEKPLTAMRREFKEEAGLLTSEWIPFAVAAVSGRGHVVHFFWNIGRIKWCAAKTDEPIVCVPVTNLPSNVLPNLRWLIPLACCPLHTSIVHFNETWSNDRA